MNSLRQGGGWGRESAPFYPNYTKFDESKYNHMKSPCAKFQVFWLKNDVIMTRSTFSVSNIWVF